MVTLTDWEGRVGQCRVEDTTSRWPNIAVMSGSRREGIGEKIRRWEREELHEKWGEGGGTMFRTQRSRFHSEFIRKDVAFFNNFAPECINPSSNSSFLTSLGRGGIVSIWMRPCMHSMHCVISWKILLDSYSQDNYCFTYWVRKVTYRVNVIWYLWLKVELG